MEEEVPGVGPENAGEAREGNVPGNAEESGGGDGEESGHGAPANGNGHAGDEVGQTPGDGDTQMTETQTGADTQQVANDNQQGQGQGQGEDTSANTDDFEWWTHEKEDSLIDKFRDATYLWDKRAAGYKLKNKYEIAYKAWSSDLPIPGKQKATPRHVWREETPIHCPTPCLFKKFIMYNSSTAYVNHWGCNTHQNYIKNI